MVPAFGAPGKSANTCVAPALPSTAPVAVQASGVNWALMTIGTGLVRVAPQMLAAWVKAIRRCLPSVVPSLPPTGVAGVGSLKPTPGAFRLLMTIVAAAWAEPAAPHARARPAASRVRLGRLLDFML